MRFAWLFATLLLVASPAHADPITTAVTAVFTAINSTVIGSALLRIGIGMALSALGRALGPKPEKPKAPGLFSEYTAGEGVPLTGVLGLSAVRGHKLGPSYSEGSGPTPNKRLYRPTIISDMPVTSLQSVIIEGEEHSVSGTSVSGKFGAWFRFTGLHFAPNASTDAEMLTDFGGHGERPWQSDMIGRDIAWLVPVMETDVDGDKFTSEPFPLYEVQGAPLYDPRIGATAYTENPVVMIWNILRGIEIPGVGTWGLNVEEDDLPAAMWEAAMDVCDEVTGGEARYRAGIEFGLNNEPLEIIGELLKACGGDIADCGGSWRITVGPPETPVWSFDDGDVVITEGRDFQPFKGLAETYNGVSATYRDPRNAWEETQAEPYYNTEWEAEDGRKSIAELVLPAVPYPKQVRRLMREMGDDNRRMRVHSFTQPKSALHVMPLNNEAWTSEENGYDAKSFEVVSKSFDPVSLVSRVAVRERDPEDYDFDEDFDAVLPDPPSRVRDDFTIYGVEGWDIEGATLALGAEERGSEVPAVHCVWALTEVDSIDIELRLAATSEGIGGGRFSARPGEVYIPLPLFAGRQVEGRAKVGAAGRPTTWTPWVLTTLPGNFITYGSFSEQIEADIKAGRAEVLNATRVARGIEPVEIVDELPAAGDAGRLVYLSTDQTLYYDTGAVWTTTIPPEAITGPIGASQLADGAVTATKITDSAVTTNKIAANAVTAGQIAAAAIGTSQLAAGAVIAGKIGADAVTAEKVAANSITAANGAIANLTVGTLKIIDGAISENVGLVQGGQHAHDSHHAPSLLLSGAVTLTGNPVLIHISCVFESRNANGGFCGISIERDGVNVGGASGTMPAVSGFPLSVERVFTDLSGVTGSYTYRLYGQTGANLDVYLRNAQLALIHMKK